MRFKNAALAVAGSLIIGTAGAIVATPAYASGTIYVYNSSNSNAKIKVYNDQALVEHYLAPGYNSSISDVGDAARVDIDPDGSGPDVQSYRYRDGNTIYYSRWYCGEPRDFNPYSGLNGHSRTTYIQNSAFTNGAC